MLVSVYLYPSSVPHIPVCLFSFCVLPFSLVLPVISHIEQHRHLGTEALDSTLPALMSTQNHTFPRTHTHTHYLSSQFNATHHIHRQFNLNTASTHYPPISLLFENHLSFNPLSIPQITDPKPQPPYTKNLTT